VRIVWKISISTVAAVTGWLLHPSYNAAAHVAFTLAYVSGAWDLALAVWEDFRKLRFNTQFLMLLVAVGAASIGAWGEGALLLILFSWSAAMETFAAGRTQREISALLKGAPKTARLLDGDKEREVTVESLRPGDVIRVTAGEQAPVDFEITQGRSACDESTLTGEAEPISKAAGDTALAGTLNLWGVLEGRVLRAAGDSALQRIIRLIHEAQQQKAPIQRFTDRFGTGYTATVIAACVTLFLVTWLGFGAPPLVSAGKNLKKSRPRPSPRMMSDAVAMPGNIGTRWSRLARTTSSVRPGLTTNFAPALAASANWLALVTVPAPTSAPGTSAAILAMASSATGLRRVISSTSSPPSTSALASGTAWARSLRTITGTMRTAASFSRSSMLRPEM
jgi:hypothetical protein